MDHIYTITLCEKLETDEYGWPAFGAERIVGWYASFGNAELCVKKNYGNIFDYCYNYAIIEKVYQGIYPSVPRRWFYKWDIEKQGYSLIEEPKFMKHFINISMG